MKPSSFFFFPFVLLFLCGMQGKAQVLINEGSNRNHQNAVDEDGDAPDWIELYNAGTDSVQLAGYSLSKPGSTPWVFPSRKLAPGGFLVVYCSGKNRQPRGPFLPVINETNFTPVVGWNQHAFSQPFVWNGTDHILLDVCSYSNTGYTVNSAVRQSATSFFSTRYFFQDGSDFACGAPYGSLVKQRPNMKINGMAIGSGTIENGATSYPAPYGNWYWGARHQMLLRATELLAAGILPGTLNNLAFDVTWTDPNTVYTHWDVAIRAVPDTSLDAVFMPFDSLLNLHTHFTIRQQGDTVILRKPDGSRADTRWIFVPDLGISTGAQPNGSTTTQVLLYPPTPGASNNGQPAFSQQLLAPVFGTASGLFPQPINATLSNPNPAGTLLRYTLDGSEPDTASAAFTGAPIPIYFSSCLRAKAFGPGVIPSPTATASYLIGINHTTPVLSVVTDPENLYGASGIFDNWQFDWKKSAYAAYFDSTQTHDMVFSRQAALQVDGGLGGSRSHPQRSFRLDFDHGSLGSGRVNEVLIPTKPYRNRYSSIYLRNGSNQVLNYPYKDACQAEQMGRGVNTYYQGWRPVSVYINGNYFGLYELREKYDGELLSEQDGGDPDSVSVLSQSIWYGGALRAVQGNLNDFYTDFDFIQTLSPTDTSFWTSLNQRFDVPFYHDYIIGESWMGNRDWPWNNIKIIRSPQSGNRWRFGLQDLELALNPDGVTTSADDPFDFLFNVDPAIPYTRIWQIGINNPRFRRYFINRFADLINTRYRSWVLLGIESRMFAQVAPELPKLFARWVDPNQIPASMNTFLGKRAAFRQEIAARNPILRQKINQNFGLNGEVTIGIATEPANAGVIKLNTIQPDSLPWTGVYFSGNPIRLEAIALPGYQFLYWDTNAVVPSVVTDAVLEVDPTAPVQFRAVFGPAVPPKIEFTELMYKADSTLACGDWLELHNSAIDSLDIGGWRLSDGGHLNTYSIPAGTVLPPDGYLVLCSNPAQFQARYPGVPHLGPLGFNLASTSETLELSTAQGIPLRTVTYSGSAPWPLLANGAGFTLERLAEVLPADSSGSWFVGCLGGSPGGPFVPCSDPVEISEINYNSNVAFDAGDWVELHNRAIVPLDLSGWVFRDGDITHAFVFPVGTVLAPDARMVVCTNPLLFSVRHPAVVQPLGPTGFGFSSSGEALRVYDAGGTLRHSVTYSVAAPWSSGANGLGYTLERVSSGTLGNYAGHWSTMCLEGSPGTNWHLPCDAAGLTEGVDEDVRLVPQPNPSGSEAVLWLTSEVQVGSRLIISDALGRRVWSIAVQQRRVELPAAALEPGIYHLEWSNGSVVEKGRWMLMR